MLLKFQGCPFLFPLDKCLLIPFIHHEESLRSADGIVENRGGDFFVQEHRPFLVVLRVKGLFLPTCGGSECNKPPLLPLEVWCRSCLCSRHLTSVRSLFFTSVNEVVYVLESQGPKNPWHLHPKLYSECIGRNSSEIKWNVKWCLAGKNMDLLLVIRRKAASDNKNKALCWENLNRYLMVLLYSMWNMQMRLLDGTRGTCRDSSKINNTSCSGSQQWAEILTVPSCIVIKYS